MSFFTQDDGGASFFKDSKPKEATAREAIQPAAANDKTESKRGMFAADNDEDDDFGFGEFDVGNLDDDPEPPAPAPKQAAPAVSLTDSLSGMTALAKYAAKGNSAAAEVEAAVSPGDTCHPEPQKQPATCTDETDPDSNLEAQAGEGGNLPASKGGNLEGLQQQAAAVGADLVGHEAGPDLAHDAIMTDAVPPEQTVATKDSDGPIAAVAALDAEDPATEAAGSTAMVIDTPEDAPMAIDEQQNKIETEFNSPRDGFQRPVQPEERSVMVTDEMAAVAAEELCTAAGVSPVPEASDDIAMAAAEKAVLATTQAAATAAAAPLVVGDAEIKQADQVANQRTATAAVNSTAAAAEVNEAKPSAAPADLLQQPAAVTSDRNAAAAAAELPAVASATITATAAVAATQEVLVPAAAAKMAMLAAAVPTAAPAAGTTAGNIVLAPVIMQAPVSEKLCPDPAGTRSNATDPAPPAAAVAADPTQVNTTIPSSTPASSIVPAALNVALPSDNQPSQQQRHATASTLTTPTAATAAAAAAVKEPQPIGSDEGITFAAPAALPATAAATTPLPFSSTPLCQPAAASAASAGVNGSSVAPTAPQQVLFTTPAKAVPATAAAIAAAIAAAPAPAAAVAIPGANLNTNSSTMFGSPIQTAPTPVTTAAPVATTTLPTAAAATAAVTTCSVTNSLPTADKAAAATLTSTAPPPGAAAAATPMGYGASTAATTTPPAGAPVRVPSLSNNPFSMQLKPQPPQQQQQHRPHLKPMFPLTLATAAPKSGGPAAAGSGGPARPRMPSMSTLAPKTSSIPATVAAASSNSPKLQIRTSAPLHISKLGVPAAAATAAAGSTKLSAVTPSPLSAVHSKPAAAADGGVALTAGRICPGMLGGTGPGPGNQLPRLNQVAAVAATAAESLTAATSAATSMKPLSVSGALKIADISAVSSDPAAAAAAATPAANISVPAMPDNKSPAAMDIDPSRATVAAAAAPRFTPAAAGLDDQLMDMTPQRATAVAATPPSAANAVGAGCVEVGGAVGGDDDLPPPAARLLQEPARRLEELRISSRDVSDQLLDIRVQLAMLANRQTRLDNPMLEARIKRIKLVLDESVGENGERQDQQDQDAAAVS